MCRTVLNSVQRPIEAALAIHVLSVFALFADMYSGHIVAGYMFAFGRIERSKAHQFHHVLFFFGLTFQILFGDFRSL